MSAIELVIEKGWDDKLPTGKELKAAQAELTIRDEIVLTAREFLPIAKSTARNDDVWNRALSKLTAALEKMK